MLETCRKDDLILIAQHFVIPVSRTLLKKDLKACLVAGLISKRVLPSVGDVPTSAESVTPVMDEEEQAPPLPLTSRCSLVGDPVTPGTSGGVKVGPPLFLPKF